MKSTKFIVLSLAMIIVVTTFSYPQMRQRNFDDMRQMVKNKLNLTPEQEKKISDLRFQHQEKLIDLTSDLKKKNLEKEKILSADVVKRDELIKVTKEIGELRNKVEVENINHQMDVYDILDANQKSVWKDMQLKKEKMKFMMKDRMKERFHDKMKNNRMRPPENETEPEQEQ